MKVSDLKCDNLPEFIRRASYGFRFGPGSTCKDMIEALENSENPTHLILAFLLAKELEREKTEQ